LGKPKITETLDKLSSNTAIKNSMYLLSIIIFFMLILTVAMCCPASASGSISKPARLETGAVIQVPLFVQKGDRVKVDTRGGNYIERA